MTGDSKGLLPLTWHTEGREKGEQVSRVARIQSMALKRKQGRNSEANYNTHTETHTLSLSLTKKPSDFSGSANMSLINDTIDFKNVSSVLQVGVHDQAYLDQQGQMIRRN